MNAGGLLLNTNCIIYDAKIIAVVLGREKAWQRENSSARSNTRTCQIATIQYYNIIQPQYSYYSNSFLALNAYSFVNNNEAINSWMPAVLSSLAISLHKTVILRDPWHNYYNFTSWVLLHVPLLCAYIFVYTIMQISLMLTLQSC